MPRQQARLKKPHALGWPEQPGHRRRPSSYGAHTAKASASSVERATVNKAAADPLVYRLSGGRFTSVHLPMLFSPTPGRARGKIDDVAGHFTDGGDAIVVASNYGRKNHPAWSYNVKANPEVELSVAGRVCRYRAQVTADEDRERLWKLVVQHTRAYGDYVKRAEGRTIQVIRLSPLDSSD
jgi:deazaflavin-dependent oxidoreductase (nitroreductase family)